MFQNVVKTCQLDKIEKKRQSKRTLKIKWSYYIRERYCVGHGDDLFLDEDVW